MNPAYKSSHKLIQESHTQPMHLLESQSTGEQSIHRATPVMILDPALVTPNINIVVMLQPQPQVTSVSFAFTIQFRMDTHITPTVYQVVPPVPVTRVTILQNSD